jgi:hypothetical protein
MSISSVLGRWWLAVAVAACCGLVPSLAQAEIQVGVACSGKKAKSEKRTTDISYFIPVVWNIPQEEWENMYCVTHVKCVALGHCRADSPEEQDAADKLKQEIAAEEARLQRERRAKIAEAERRRERERQQADEERRQKAIVDAAEAARREKQLAADVARRAKQAADDAKRFGVSVDTAKELTDAREAARKKMPPAPEKCVIDHPASTQELDFTPMTMMQAKAQRDYAAVDRGQLCGGRGGSLGPLDCDKPADFFGAKFGSCKSVMRCAAYQETRQCARVTPQ